MFSLIRLRKNWSSMMTPLYKILLFQGHPTSIFGKYLFGKRFEI